MSEVRASYLLGLVLVAIALASAFASNKDYRSPLAPTVSFVTAPDVLPRNQPELNYSPLVSISYANLEVGTYTLEVRLLETDPPGPPFCGTSELAGFWCPAVFTINNENGTNSSGTIVDARITNVNDYQNFLWVADLFKNGIGVTSATRPATSTPNRAPVLNPIGKKTVSASQSLDFTLSASDPEGDPVTFSAQNLPGGATLNSAGQFHWQPSTPGTFPKIAFIATQTGGTPLSDAELIEIQVDPQQPPGTLAFSTNSNTTGEGGPVVLFVNRTNGSGGTVSVAYSTANGTATPGADYTAVTSGSLTFANGELTKSIRLSIINDPEIESNENFQVTLSSPTGGATLGSPSQANVTIFDDDTPSSAGQWTGVSTWPSVPIHMHLLPSGKVMFWDRGPEHENPNWDVTPHLWDPLVPGSFANTPLAAWNIFCSGHNIMADGRVFVAGGHIHDFEGAETAGVYDLQTNAWTALPNMNAGRWYPTTTVLPNGDVLVISGTIKKYADINPGPQIWQVNSGSWRSLSNAQMGAYPSWPDLYPYSYVAPNGKIFIAGPQKTARYLDTTGTGAWTNLANSSICYRDYGSSVMYNDGKVLIVGGNPRDDCDPNIPRPIFPTATAEVIDLNAATPSWRPVSSMAIGRRHLNATLLPDGKVLITGGSSLPGHDDPAGGVFFAELWDPSSESFVPLASHSRYRGYHSNALLLPDARVLVAGGGHPDPIGGFAENNAEIYSPPYLFRGARPTISGAPTVVTYGQTFLVQTPEAANITNVNWVRLGSTTHAFNESQRINRLTFSQGNGGLNVTSPASAALCPPGHYMLFVLNSNGVPSVARIIQIAANPSTSMQLILEEAHGGTNLATAIDSPLFLRDPFLVLNNSNFLAPQFDRNTRVMVFVTNLELAAGDPASSVTVQLTDSSNATQTISAEDVRRVPGFDISQVMFRLPSNLPPGNYAIKVIAKGQTTNSAVIRIRAPLG